MKYGELSLEQIEQLCHEALHGHDAFEYEGQGVNWYNGGWSPDCPGPKDVLALVARIRELQREKNHLEMLLRDAATDHESDCYESHKAGRREMAEMWRGVHFNCPGCGRMLKNEAPR